MALKKIILNAEEINLPTMTSDLTNDSGFITADDVPAEIEVIQIAANMASSSFAFTADEITAIATAYNAGKTVLLKSTGTNLRYGQGYIMPNLTVATQAGNYMLYLSFFIATVYMQVQAKLINGTATTTINKTIDLTTLGTEIVEVTDPTAITMLPNTIHVMSSSAVSSITIDGFTEPTELTAEYTLHFFTGSSVDSFTLPEEVAWANGTAPTIEASTAYELSVVATKINDNIVYKAVLTPFTAAL